MYGIGTRMAKCAFFGFITTAFLFRNKKLRLSGFYYGAGVGLGLSSPQLSALYN
jgi:hypothetical protein